MEATIDLNFNIILECATDFKQLQYKTKAPMLIARVFLPPIGFDVIVVCCRLCGSARVHVYSRSQ